MIEMVGIPVTRHLEPNTWHRIDAEGRTPNPVPGTWHLGPGAGLTPRTEPGHWKPRASGL